MPAADCLQTSDLPKRLSSRRCQGDKPGAEQALNEDHSFTDGAEDGYYLDYLALTTNSSGSSSRSRASVSSSSLHPAPATSDRRKALGCRKPSEMGRSHGARGAIPALNCKSRLGVEVKCQSKDMILAYL